MDAQFDLLLRGGRVIDPASGRDGVADIGISGGRIAAIEPASAGAPRAGDRCARQNRHRRHDRHARPCLSTRHRPLRPERRHGRRAFRRHHRGGPGRPELHDHPGLPRTSSWSRRERRVLCFISAYLVGGLEGHLYPALYGPDQVDVKATIRAGRANADIVRGVKAHAEIGGASRWGLEVIKLGKRIASELGVPLYIHLGQLWPVKDGADDRPGRGGARTDAADGAGRRAGASVHPPSRRLRFRRDRRGASGGVGGAGTRRDGRCRPRLAFQLRDGAAHASPPASARTRWAPTCTATTCACPATAIRRDARRTRSSASRRST